MAARKQTRKSTASTKKTTRGRSSVAKNTSKTATKKEPWYAKYSYSRGEVVYRLAWLVVLVFIFVNYRSVVVAATVNGEPISRLSVVQELEAQQGAAVLDNMINEALIRQQADNDNIVVSDEEVNERIASIEAELKNQGQALDDILTSQSLSREDLAKQIRLQLTAEKLIQDKIQITDDEVNKYVEDNASYFSPDATDEDKKAQAMDQLKQQKLSTEFNKWLSDQRNSADISRFVTY